MTNFYKTVKDKLDSHSSSLCLAKWKQVTIHLQNGQTHSCHHPMTHKVPVTELEKDPSALHNTKFKKEIRKQMLSGERPSECDYCWKIEDAHSDNFSDRVLKSADPWAYPFFEEVVNNSWGKSVNPSYLEISFGNECNFRCGYCMPHISSAVMKEYTTFGSYKGIPQWDLKNLREQGLMPYFKEDHNPYVEAFWNWWPSLSKDLKVFRITGGEPLLNANTFRFLEKLKAEPMPELSLAINTNLGIPSVTFKKFISEIKDVTERNLVKDLQLYTSVDTYGKNAEFIRFGLNYSEFIRNVRIFLSEVKEAQLVIMCAYNAFSVINFKYLLQEVTQLKEEFKDKNGNPRVLLDTPYLKDPSMLSCYVLDETYWQFVRADLEYLKQHADLYMPHEITKFERILNWLENLKETNHRRSVRKALAIFIDEYVERKNIKFENYCP